LSRDDDAEFVSINSTSAPLTLVNGWPNNQIDAMMPWAHEKSPT
jgi:hypothetical protein